MSLLDVRNLTIRGRASSRTVINEVSFNLAASEVIGIVGESGAGKTSLARALLGLLDPVHWEVCGSALLQGVEVLNQSETRLQKIRGAKVSLIPQEPELALHPLLRIEQQVEEVLRAHSSLTNRHRRAQVRQMLEAVGLPAGRLHDAYPHQLSGGERQRAVIAQSLISKPAILIADEPTSALDTVTQKGVLDLLKTLRHRAQLSLLFITHDFALLNGLVDRILILREGTIVESGAFEEVHANPQHPYTQSLKNAVLHPPDWFRLRTPSPC